LRHLAELIANYSVHGAERAAEKILLKFIKKKITVWITIIALWGIRKPKMEVVRL